MLLLKNNYSFNVQEFVLENQDNNHEKWKEQALFIKVLAYFKNKIHDAKQIVKKLQKAQI